MHKRFPERLAHVLPASDRPPIVMTDAGFRNPWFRLVAARGWPWLGRVRNRDYVKPADVLDWQPAKDLYAQARTTAENLGLYDTVRNHPLRCSLILVKRVPRGRKTAIPAVGNSATALPGNVPHATVSPGN